MERVLDQSSGAPLPRGAAIVTGAAGGMGAAIARELASGRERLILCDLHPQPLQRLADELRDRTEVRVVAGDITDPQLPQQLMAALDTCDLTLLAHTAGVSPSMTDGRQIFSDQLRSHQTHH